MTTTSIVAHTFTNKGVLDSRCSMLGVYDNNSEWLKLHRKTTQKSHVADFSPISFQHDMTLDQATKCLPFKYLLSLDFDKLFSMVRSA